MDTTMTIGRLARRVGVGVETLRFYETKGLIEAPPRKSSGYRLYPVDTVSRVEFIKMARELGFSLEEIREILDLRVETETSCDDVRRRGEAKLAQVREKLEVLRNMEKALEALVATCDEQGADARCPFLDAWAEQPIQKAS